MYDNGKSCEYRFWSYVSLLYFDLAGGHHLEIKIDLKSLVISKFIRWKSDSAENIFELGFIVT